MEFLKDLAFPTVALIIGSIMLLLAIAKKIKTKFIEFPEIKTPQQRLQMGVAGFVLILASLVLQFFASSTPTTKTESTELVSLTAAQSTISALETQMALSSVAPIVPSSPSAIPIPTYTITSAANVSQTPVPTFTPTQILLAATSPATEEFCVNFSMVSVRSGPDMSFPETSILENRKRNSDPVCLRFDFRMPDNSWARIAPNQENSYYHQYELGWLLADQLRPGDVSVLNIYVPDGVKNGKYCVMNRSGVNIRQCSNNSCSIKGTLSMQDCIDIDGRSEDSQWIRISANQEENKYILYKGNWINSDYMAPFELSNQYNPYIKFYIGLLPIITPTPTPGG